MVDWSSGLSDAPGKDAGGTEINPSPFKMTVSAVDITFFIY